MREGPFDFADGYLRCVDRIDHMVREAARTSTNVVACPDWTIRDLVGHLAGLAEDWNVGRLDTYASDAWTLAQIDRHRHESLDDLFALWHDQADRLVTLADDSVLGPPARWAFGDALIHEADVAESLFVVCDAPDPVIETHLSAGLRRWSGQLADASIRLSVQTDEGRNWTLGADDGSGLVEVRGSTYELWRSVYGRRSASRIRRLEWSTDPATVLESGLPYPFTIPHDFPAAP